MLPSGFLLHAGPEEGAGWFVLRKFEERLGLAGLGFIAFGGWVAEEEDHGGVPFYILVLIALGSRQVVNEPGKEWVGGTFLEHHAGKLVFSCTDKVNSSPEALEAFRRAMEDPYFVGSPYRE